MWRDSSMCDMPRDMTFILMRQNSIHMCSCPWVRRALRIVDPLTNKWCGAPDIWLTHVWPASWYESFIYVTTYSCVTCLVKWLIHMWHDSFINMVALVFGVLSWIGKNKLCDVTHSCVTCRVTWLMHTWHDSFLRVVFLCFARSGEMHKNWIGSWFFRFVKCSLFSSLSVELKKRNRKIPNSHQNTELAVSNYNCWEISWEILTYQPETNLKN